MMTMNYFWWLFRDTMLYWLRNTGSIPSMMEYPKMKYTMDFMVELEEKIAQKLESKEKNIEKVP